MLAVKILMEKTDKFLVIYSILPISYSTGYIGTSSKGVMKYFIEKSPGKNNKDSARFEPYSNKGNEF